MPVDVCSVGSAAPYTVVRLPAELDITNADQVREELLRILSCGPVSVIVDMTRTSFCAAAGIHALMRARRRADTAAIDLRVAVSSPIVHRILSIAGADRLLEICPSVDAAVASLPSPPRSPRDGQGTRDGQAAGDGQITFCPGGRTGRAEEARR